MTDRPGWIDLQVRLPLDFKAKAQARANELGLLLSQYVRKLIATDIGIEAPPLKRGQPRKPKPPKVPKKRGRPRKTVAPDAR